MPGYLNGQKDNVSMSTLIFCIYSVNSNLNALPSDKFKKDKKKRTPNYNSIL